MSKPDWLFPSAGKSQCAGCDTLRSDLSKREAEVARLTMGLQCVAREAEITGAKHLAASMAHLALWYAKDTAQAAKAHDDKVAREVWKEAVQMVENHPSHLLAHSHTTEAGPCDLCCLTRKFKDKAEQGGK